MFTGLYRLGRPTSASFLDVHPDIAVNAKLLTGGLIPLCTTVASQEIFDTFSSPEKSDALLHGHSYTAHASGCTVAVDSLRAMSKMDKDGSWDGYRADWQNTSTPSTASTPEVWSVWSNGLLKDLSCAESVESVFAIGTVLSISLRDAQGGGRSYLGPVLSFSTNDVFRLYLYRCEGLAAEARRRWRSIQRSFPGFGKCVVLDV